MKKLLVFAMSAAVIATTCACGNKNQPTEGTYSDSTEFVVEQNTTIYGVCLELKKDSTLCMLNDNGDSISISVRLAFESDHIMGGINKGDRIIVNSNAKKTEALNVINQTMLLGNWTMPNPLDGSDEVGISIKEGGIVEGIDQSTISYRTWRIVDGQLELVSIREGGGQEEETNYYDIIKLSKDSLIFKDAEDTFEYGRQKPRETYGKDVKLEDTSFNDFAI